MVIEIVQYALLANAGIWVAFTVIGMLDRWAYPALKPSTTPMSSDEHTISIIIPARNEASNIERCVRSAMEQDYANIEIIVVDDQSTDGTDTIVESLAATDDRITLVRGEALPKGWVGKGWALCQGREKATGNWVFVTGC